MKLITKSAYLMAMLISGFSIMASTDLTKKQAKNYIKQVVYNLFGPNHTSQTLDSMDRFISSATPGILSNAGRKTYSTKRVYKSTLNKVVNFIEQKSHDYALEELNKKSVNDRYLVASGIAHKLANEVRSIINTHSWLQNNVFETYIGSKLKARVQGHINKKVKPANFKKSGFDNLYTDVYYQPVMSPVSYCQPVYQPVVNKVYTEYYTPVQPCVLVEKEILPTNYVYFKQPNWGFSFNFKS